MILAVGSRGKKHYLIWRKYTVQYRHLVMYNFGQKSFSVQLLSSHWILKGSFLPRTRTRRGHALQRGAGSGPARAGAAPYVCLCTFCIGGEKLQHPHSPFLITHRISHCTWLWVGAPAIRGKTAGGGRRKTRERLMDTPRTWCSEEGWFWPPRSAPR